MAFEPIDAAAFRTVPHPAVTQKGHSGRQHTFSKGETAVSIIVPEHNGTASPNAKSLEGVPTAGVSRHVINLELNVVKDGAKVNHFPHPVELRVNLAPGDHAKSDPKLLVHWHDGDAAHMRWMEIPTDWTAEHQGHKFHKDSNDLVVFLTYWPDDPAVGMD